MKGLSGMTPLFAACQNGQLETVHILISEFGCDAMAKDENSDTLLHITALNGHHHVIRQLVTEFGCDADVKGQGGMTPLFHACRNGQFETVHMLISEFGCDAMARDEDGNTPLHMAALNGHLHVIRLLVTEFGCSADVNGRDGRTPLHAACQSGHLEIVHMLISEFGCDAMTRSEDSDTPLHMAALNGHHHVIRLLVTEFGCNPDVKGQGGRTPLFAACQNSRFEAVRMLISEFVCSQLSLDDMDNSCIHIAAMYGHADIIRDLVSRYHYPADYPNRFENTALHLAALHGHADIVKMLITEFGCDANAVGWLGRTPLHCVALHGHADIVRMLITEFGCDANAVEWLGQTPLHCAFEGGHVEIINMLITEFRCNPLTESECGTTALHTAAAFGHIKIVRELVNMFNFVIDSQDELGDTPLHLAASHNQLEIINVLVNEFQCDVNTKGHHSNTALHCASAKGHLEIVELLISKYGADQYARDERKNTPINVAALNGQTEVVRVLVNTFKCNPSTKGFRGRTPLNQACRVGSSKLLKLLVSEMTCNIDVKDDDGNTPLHIAAMHTKVSLPLDIAATYSQLDILRELVCQYGSFTECVNSKGQAAIHLAAERGHEIAVSVLISQCKCDPNVTDADGNTILHYAAKAGNHILVEKLLSIYKVASDVKNNTGHTPLHYAIRDRQINVVAELVKYNCKPSTVDNEYKLLEESSTKKLSEGSLTKVFVIGNVEVGKSTLVEALRNENQHDPRFKATPHTAGIVPSIHESNQYGRVLFYDFAGDPEYYSSHAAALERLLTSSCHIFLLVVNLSENFEAALHVLGYWMAFISYNSKSLEGKSQVVIVGSHADIVESRGDDGEDVVCELFAEASAQLCDQHQYTEMIGYCALDCRETQSRGIQKLYSLLKHCHLTSRNERSTEVSVGASILLGVLERDFRGNVACQVSEIRTHIEFKEIFLPLEVPDVYSYLQELNTHGVILILGNREGLNEEWVILNISAFLTSVHRKLFAPSSLTRCTRGSLSNLGIIAESDLKNILPDFNPQLLKQCLKHLQYCIQIDDPEVVKMVSATTSESQTTFETENKLLFFPALLKVEKSKIDWSNMQDFTCKGRYIECSQESDYFPPRFLHVLLLRLAFNYALPARRLSKTSDLYSRRCNMWKNGIHWLMENGVECVVEVVKQNKGVVVMARSPKEYEVECVCTLVNVMCKVLEARQEFCHSLAASVYIIHPDDLNQTTIPGVESLHLFDMDEIKKAWESKTQNVIVTVDGSKSLPLNKLQTHSIWIIFFPITTGEVLMCLEQVVGEWHFLGLQLGVEEAKLGTIEYDYEKDVQARKRRMVQEWLKLPQPSWCSLVKALNDIRMTVAATKTSKAHSEVLEVQKALVDENQADVEITEDFINKFTQLEAINSRWPLLASLLSFTTAEIEQIKREVIGARAVKAAAMMNKWRERTTATYGTLRSKLSSSLEEVTMQHTNFVAT